MRATSMAIIFAGTAIVGPAAAGDDAPEVIREPPREYVRVIDRAYRRVGTPFTCAP